MASNGSNSVPVPTSSRPRSAPTLSASFTRTSPRTAASPTSSPSVPAIRPPRRHCWRVSPPRLQLRPCGRPRPPPPTPPPPIRRSSRRRSSTAPPQRRPHQFRAEIRISFDVLRCRALCSSLVFGLGHDSLMWSAFNAGGTIVFLEQNYSLPTPSVTTGLVDADDLLKSYRSEPYCLPPPPPPLKNNHRCFSGDGGRGLQNGHGSASTWQHTFSPVYH